MRSFFKNWLFGALSASLLYLGNIVGAFGQEIAVIGPVEGSSDIIGQTMQIGAAAFNPNIEMINDGCDPAIGRLAAENALARGARIIIGYPCVEALDAAALVLRDSESEAILISLGVEVPDVTSRDKRSDWPVFRFAPNESEEAETIANYLKSNWRNFDFAMIDDGTLYGRQFIEDVRFLLESDNLKPVFVDNYRPLLENQSGMLRRLQRSGASHVLVGGDAFDASVMGRGADTLRIRLNFAGGVAFLAPPQDGRLPNGTIFAALDRVSVKVGETELSGFALNTYAALQIAGQALDYAEEKGVSLSLAMRALRFETALGPVSFGNDGENTREWYTIYKVVDGRTIPLRESLAQ